MRRYSMSARNRLDMSKFSGLEGSRSKVFLYLYTHRLTTKLIACLMTVNLFLPSLLQSLLLPLPHHLITLQVCEWSRNWWHLIHRWWWYGCPRPGCSQIVTSLCCATWRRWAVDWSTGPRPYSTVSTSSGPFRSWPAMGCLFLTPSPTVNQHFSWRFSQCRRVVVALCCCN